MKYCSTIKMKEILNLLPEGISKTKERNHKPKTIDFGPTYINVQKR